MRILYSLLTHTTSVPLWVAQVFSPKLKLFIEGRKGVYPALKAAIKPDDKTIWFHCASLGEFEQGVPIIEEIKTLFPNHKIVVSFFSPSGYEIKKDSPLAHVVVYLPLDTISNAKKFISLVHPSLAFMVKGDLWYNYLNELEKRDIPTYLISGLFRKKKQPKPWLYRMLFRLIYGGFFLVFYETVLPRILGKFDHLFVQDAFSENYLAKINVTNVTVTGDTRFDRVSHQIEMDNTLEFIADFKNEAVCIVCGSTWPEDEEVLLDYINKEEKNVKFILAPHKIDADKIESFRNRLKQKSILFSEKEGKHLANYDVLIIDTIGILTKIYNYADIAYVGGAMGNTGLHNILEPATFGVPVVIGNDYNRFPEAIRLRHLAGLYSISNASECTEILSKLVDDKSFRSKTGMIAGHFVNNNTGATAKTIKYIKDLHGDSIV